MKLFSQMVMIIALVVLVALVVFAGPAACNKIRSMGAQSRVNQSQAGAYANSASDAVNTLGNASSNEAETEAQTQSSEKDIRNAEGSNAAVNPAARDAGLRALCLRRAYRDSERCKLLKPAA